MVQAWIFLKTRSLAVVILLHSVSNLFINLQRVTLLCYPDFVRGLFLVN
jgi:membrane protease YdiL (CAAX protease family)